MSNTVAVVTYNNPHQLSDTLLSLVRNTDFTGRLMVVNNGAQRVNGQDYYEFIQGQIPYELDWIDAGKNLGWEGGVNLALEHADTKFFTMLNDDVLFPPANTEWWSRTLRWFDIPTVGGVGPTSNYVSGFQSAFSHIGFPCLSVSYLIGFCATYKTDMLKAFGGLDTSLPGGDDLDLSIRTRDAGYHLIADRRNYLHHYGAQTGNRVHPGEWDSQKHRMDTVNALARKHGVRRWYECVNGEGADWPTFTIPQHAVRVTRRAMQSNDATIDGFYAKSRYTPSDVNEHLPILYRLASGCDVVCESGVADCTTTAALLKGRPRELHSFDIVRQKNVDFVEQIAAKEGQHFKFHHGSILEADFPECDFWYIDDLHTYAHVKAELDAHGHKVRKYIAFHDTELCGDRSEDGTHPGIWQAISEYQREHPEWRLKHHTEDYCGLTVLERF